MMSKQKDKWESEEFLSDKSASSEEETDTIDEAFTQEEFKQQYRDLPIWKQVILLVLFLGAMVTVITLINYIVDFGAELIKIFIQR